MKKTGKIIDRFEANGEKYVIHDWIPMGYMKDHDILLAEIQAGQNNTDIQKQRLRWLDLFNKMKHGTIIHEIHNAINAAKKASTFRNNSGFLFCTLFIVREGHHRTRWDKTVALTYIDDWIESGINSTDFLDIAFKAAGIYSETLLKSSLNILEAKPRM